MPFDLPGDPELAHAIATVAARRADTFVNACDDPHLGIHYPTVYLTPFLQHDSSRPARRQTRGLWTLATQGGGEQHRAMEFRAIRDAIDTAVSEWRERGNAYEVSRLITAPVRHGLVRLSVEHPEHLPLAGPAIIVANHVSFFDSVLLMFGLPRPVSVLGKAEYTDRAVTRWLFCGAGMIPIRREDPADVTHVVAELQAVLERGGVVAVFPEGTRSRDGQLHRGHTGAAHLALLTGAPIVPAGITGTDQILPTGARLVRPFRQATIALGDPIVPPVSGEEASTNRLRRRLTDDMMREVRRLSGQHYVDAYAALPHG